MENKLVSIVIPVYNTERYLDRCVYSVVNQTYENLEILLIDDGSHDNCPEMCDRWAKKDKRIRVIHKQNAGLGMARNTGIEYATGDYICFFDSDDYVAPNAVEEAYCDAERHNSDIVCFGLCKLGSDGKVKERFVPNPGKSLFEKNEIRDHFLVGLTGLDPKTGKKWNVSMSSCSKLYSMDLIRRSSWRFVSEREIISEDFYSILQLCSYAKKISIVPQALYYYCENADSLTHIYRPDRFEKACHFYTTMVALCMDLGYRQEVIDNMAGIYLSFVITAMKQENKAPLRYREKIANLQKMVDNTLLQTVLGNRNIKVDNLKKRILFWSIRKKKYSLCNLFLFAQNLMRK